MRPDFDLSVYFIVDPSLCAGKDIADVVLVAVQGGASMVQLRNKSGNKTECLAQAAMLGELLKPYDVPFIVNDYVDVAKEVDADGVHLGQGDMSANEARKILGRGKIIGVTAFTPEHMKAIDPAIVDYAGTGPFYPTKTDKGKPVLGAEGFTRLVKLSPVPVVGIGGITAANAAAVVKAGADGVAVMRAISESADPKKETEKLVRIVKNARGGSYDFLNAKDAKLRKV